MTQSALDHVLNRLDLRGCEVLDVGCGAGFQSLALAARGALIFQADVDPEQVAAAQRRLATHYPDASLGAGLVDCQAMPFPDEYFDIVLTHSVLMYVDRARVADEVFRCLRPGGHWVIVEHLGDNPLLRIYRFLTPGRKGVDWVRQHEWPLVEKRFDVIDGKALYFLSAIVEIPMKLGLSRMAQACARPLRAIDEFLLRRFPTLQWRCWIATRLLRKPQANG